MESFILRIADINIKIEALQSFTKEYCKDFILPLSSPYEYLIHIQERDLEIERERDKDKGMYGSVELSCLYRKIAEYMITKDILLFHGSCIGVDGKAYIYTARSGTGKSTHTALLKKLLGDRMIYINDDKPLLAISKEEVRAYGTPWNGKERRGSNTSLPLKGIALLSRSETNSMKRIDKKEALVKVLSQIYLPEDKILRIKALGLINDLLERVSFYDLQVNMDIEAAITSYQTMIKEN